MGSSISFTERGLFEGVSEHVSLIKGDGAQPKMEIPAEVEKLVRE